MIRRTVFPHVNRDLFELLRAVAHDAAGIINAPLIGNVNKMFAETNPADVRKAKRKFRKLWRNAARGRYSLNASQKIMLGLGSAQPSRLQKHARRCAVSATISNRVTENYMSVTKQK
jgi:hypothetical protein